MVYKCKICGGDIVLDRETGIAECEYCGTRQTLPQFTDEGTKSLYERANAYLRQNEYDKAQNLFDQMLATNPRDSETYWGLVMCKYGVTFVRDPKTGKYIPTCNRTHYDSILNDANYLKAVEYADAEKAELYKENAATVDNIQKGIVDISKKEKPFDIFISYKETDAIGSRTKDSIRAQELYDKLTAEGYKVFFSRITLEDKIGSEYEPYIYAALASSKVMLTVCSATEFIEAPWVKNEWSRFLTLRQSDSEKTLLPLYFDMDKSGLPDEFAILSAYDMNKEGFEQELIRGIKKLIPLPVMLAERRKKFRKRFAITAGILAAVLAVAGVISYPYIRDAVKYSDAYNNAVELYNEDQYEQAKEEFDKLGDYRDSVKMSKKAADEIHKAELQAEYDAAAELYYAGRYAEAAWAFRDMSEEFDNSAEMRKKSEARWRESLAESAYDKNSHHSVIPTGYYITANGTAEVLAGNSSAKIDANSHGKIVSLADYLLPLYEDGYLYVESLYNPELEDEEYEDIIQITPECAALRSDGTVAVINGSSFSSTWDDREFLDVTAGWRNIVRLSWSNGYIGNGAPMIHHIVCGVDVDGNIMVAGSRTTPATIPDIVKDAVEGIKNAKQVVAANPYQFAVLDNDGKIHVIRGSDEDPFYVDVTEFDAPECKSIGFAIDNEDREYHNNYTEYDLIMLTKTGDLVNHDTGKTLLTDVVHICNRDYVVTASGGIYSILGDSADAKTAVHDVWNENR